MMKFRKKKGFSSSLNSKKSELSSKSESLISWIGKDNEDLDIIVKENNDDLLYIFHKEKIGGESYESIANKTFELICNISLNRNIKVENYNHKNSDKINSFFKLDKERKINEFQIDSYISNITGKKLFKIHEKFKNNFFFFENLTLKDNEN